MATGTTADYNLTRNEIITIALRKIGITANNTLITNAIDDLNLILREEDAKGTRQSKNLWALSDAAFPLVASNHIYSTTQLLASNILELVTVKYRDTSGDDSDIQIIDSQGWQALQDKNDTGDPTKVYLDNNLTLSSRLLYIDRVPSSIGTTSEVIGSDTKNYQCIMGHTSDSTNYPITGQDWKLYWVQQGSSGSAWATGTDYTNGECLIYTYKRPLYDFDTSTDNPDMPQSWIRYLIWRLAHELCSEFDVDLDQRRWVKTQYLEAMADLFESATPNTTDYHNKTIFY